MDGRILNLLFAPFIILYVLLCWIYDLCHVRRPRPLDAMGPDTACKYHSDLAWECRNHKIAQKKNAPLPLPAKRQRRLTDSPAMATGQRPHSQSTSQLLSKLPLELRQRIYTAILTDRGTILHIVQKLTTPNSALRSYYNKYQRCLGCWPCSWPVHRSFGSGESRYCLRSCTRSTQSSTPRRSGVVPYGNLIPLLLTCRQFYAEAVDLLYSCQTFSFAETRILNLFATTILAVSRLEVLQFNIEYHQRIQK